MINLIPQERLETMERKLMEEIVTEKDSRIREAGDLRSAVESLHEHIEHVKVDTSTTLDAWDQKLALACFDAVKSMQAWFSDVEENGQARFHELEEGRVSTKSALRSMHSRLSDFGSWQNQRDEARTHQFQCILARLDALRSDFIKHQQYIDKSREFQEGTRITLKALDQKVGIETAARFDIVKSMQAWPSDAVSVDSQCNEALSLMREDASGPTPLGSGGFSDPAVPAVWCEGSA